MVKDKTYKVNNKEFPKCPVCFKDSNEQREGILKCSKCGSIYSVKCEITYYSKVKELGEEYNLPFFLGDKITLKNGVFISALKEFIKCDEKSVWGIISNIDFNYYTPLYIIDWVVAPDFRGPFTWFEIKKFEEKEAK